MTASATPQLTDATAAIESTFSDANCDAALHQHTWPCSMPNPVDWVKTHM
jgi:hypothetical protein